MSSRERHPLLGVSRTVRPPSIGISVSGQRKIVVHTHLQSLNFKVGDRNIEVSGATKVTFSFVHRNFEIDMVYCIGLRWAELCSPFVLLST